MVIIKFQKTLNNHPGTVYPTKQQSSYHHLSNIIKNDSIFITWIPITFFLQIPVYLLQNLEANQ
jgi:hypothetical protein